MKVFKSEEFIKMINPNPGSTFKKEILDAKDAEGLMGVFGLVVPGGKGGNYHYHEKGEHIIIVLSGEGTEIIEGKEYPIKAGDIIFIPAGERHTTLNNSGNDLCYIGFCTCEIPGQLGAIEVD